MSSEKNIYQRVNAVMKEVEYVQKDATVTGAGGYKAVTHDQVTAVIRKSLVKNGIVIQVEQLGSQIIQQRGTNPKSDKEYSMHLYSGDYAIHFVNIEEPSDRISVTVNAHANDSGDKAPGKAMSYAVKYAMLKTFTLETGENEEARYATPYTAEQAEYYHELLEAGKAYEFYMFLKSLPPETQTGLHNSFPEGKISQGKKAANKLEAEGVAAFNAMVDDVRERLANHDISVVEITGEMSPLEKKQLASRLSVFEVNQLKKISEAAA